MNIEGKNMKICIEGQHGKSGGRMLFTGLWYLSPTYSNYGMVKTCSLRN